MTKTADTSQTQHSQVSAYPALGDKFGQTLHLTWLATAGEISIQSMAQQLGVTERTARDYVKNYKNSGDSTVLIDRRRFNSGQKRAYGIEPYRARLLEHWIMLALEGQSVGSRQLSAHLEQAVSNRTIDRFLIQSGLRQAQESGIIKRISDHFLQKRKPAYWAGIASQPLADLDHTVQPNPNTATSASIPPGAQIGSSFSLPVTDPISTTTLLWPKILGRNRQIKPLGLAELLSLSQALINLRLASVDIALLRKQVSLVNKTAPLLLPIVQQVTVAGCPTAEYLRPNVEQVTEPLLPAPIDLKPRAPLTAPLLPVDPLLKIPAATIPLLPVDPLLKMQTVTVPLLAIVTDQAVDMQPAPRAAPTGCNLLPIEQVICPNETVVTESVQELAVVQAWRQVATETAANNSMPQQAIMGHLDEPVVFSNTPCKPAAQETPSKTNSNSNSLPAAHEWQEAKVGQVGVALGLAHLSSNGAFKSLEALLPEERSGYLPNWLLTTGLMLYLLASGGQRLSQAKHFVWSKVSGLLAGKSALSASTLRNWLLTLEIRAKESIVVLRQDQKSETITRLRDYQEESIAQRHQAGLIVGSKLYLDDYVNALFRHEPIVRTKHGTKAHMVKAFRRHVCQDIETGLPVTCPLGPSNSTSSQVLEQIVSLVNGGLGRVESEGLQIVVADRWWSNEPAIRSAQKLEVALLTWTKNDPSIKKAMAEISDTEWFKLSPNQESDRKSHLIMKPQADQESDQPKKPEEIYYLDSQAMIYKLQEPVRIIAHWNGKTDGLGQKLAALAIGLASDRYKASELLNYLPYRQRVEILIKGLQRRVQLANFGGGKAIIRQEERDEPSESDQKRWQKNQKQVQTRQKKAEVRLGEVEKEIKHLESHRQAKPRNSLALGKNELKQLARSLRGKISSYGKRLAELSGLLAWARGEAEEPACPEVAELDLTREALLNQMKLDVFTAQETLINEFIEIGLKPVLLSEAREQARRRKQQAKRSASQKNKGQLLTTDVEELYKKKVANLERETILHRLTHQPGEFLLHSDKRLILSVFQRFTDKRTQSAFELYCPFINQKGIQIRLDDGPPWRLLLTYHTESVE